MTHYETLDVPSTATSDEIRAAYRKAAFAAHPDRNPTDSSAAERFCIVAEAYQVLGDVEQRAAYDMALSQHHPLNQTRPQGDSDPYDAFNTRYEAMSTGDALNMFSRAFRDLEDLLRRAKGSAGGETMGDRFVNPFRFE